MVSAHHHELGNHYHGNLFMAAFGCAGKPIQKPSINTIMERAVIITNLRKSYDAHPVLEELNLEIPKGTIFGLIGPNGAGKSTLIGVLTGLLSFETGNVAIHKIG